jgi:hypothetical protein
MCWFVSNITEALIGSAGTRWLMRGAIPFDSLRGTVAFLAASFVAVFLSSSLDSALIVLNRGAIPRSGSFGRPVSSRTWRRHGRWCRSS